MKKIILTTINAKWIHPSLALRLLKVNLGSLEDSCEIIEFALRQPLAEKLEPLLAALQPKGHGRILGISVSIWNHIATMELLKELNKTWTAQNEQCKRPIIVLGGPEVSHLPEDAEIFNYADYVICGEGEIAFRQLCEKILAGEQSDNKNKFINAENVDVCEIKTAYHLYTDEDLAKKLIYVESSRGCPFKCDFCLSAVKIEGREKGEGSREKGEGSREKGEGSREKGEGNKEKGGGNREKWGVREFPLEQFLTEMDMLIQRGVRTFKFLDRSFNINTKRSLQIIEFFLEKINKTLNPSVSSAPASLRSKERRENSSSNNSSSPFIVHFEMIPSLFQPEMLDALSRFPPGTLRLEIGIQTLNPEVAAAINRPSDSEKELNNLRFLREKTNAIIHADLIAGLPGEDLLSFGKGFDSLWLALSGGNNLSEIQLGILKLLPGAPIVRHNDAFGMCYNSLPPYEITENSAISANEINRIKNFARFWEIIVNRGLECNVNPAEFHKPVFDKFLVFADKLYNHFGRNWGIDKEELKIAVEKYL